MQRPQFSTAWSLFRDVNVSVKDVGKKICGKVGVNIASGFFENACPIRMSYVLNHLGIRIPPTGYGVVSGADGRWYMFRVRDMMTFLEKTFGTPDKLVNKEPKPTDFAGMQGIVVVKGEGWANAAGHVTLFNGAQSVCSDSCHLFADPDNGSFVPSLAAIWSLP
jgi:hypothetical protein